MVGIGSTSPNTNAAPVIRGGAGRSTHVGGIGYALFGIRAGVPTIMTREPDAATLIGAVGAGASHAFVPPVIARFIDAGDRLPEPAGGHCRHDHRRRLGAHR